MCEAAICANFAKKDSIDLHVTQTYAFKQTLNSLEPLSPLNASVQPDVSSSGSAQTCHRTSRHTRNGLNVHTPTPYVKKAETAYGASFARLKIPPRIVMLQLFQNEITFKRFWLRWTKQTRARGSQTAIEDESWLSTSWAYQISPKPSL